MKTFEEFREQIRHIPWYAVEFTSRKEYHAYTMVIYNAYIMELHNAYKQGYEEGHDDGYYDGYEEAYDPF